MVDMNGSGFRNMLLGITCFASLTVATVSPAEEASESWRFAVCADSRSDAVFGAAGYSPDNGVNRQVLNKLIAQLNKEKLDFVLFTGDAVMGEKKQDFKPGEIGSLEFEMKGWIELMKKLNCPWYFSVGNHEAYRESNAAALRRAFKAGGRQMPTNGPANQTQLVYSFDHKNAHFVNLNCYQAGAPHQVQTDWLQSDLAATKKEHVFVMSHEPAFSVTGEKEKCLEASPSDRDKFWAVMTGKHVEAYFCAHEHIYYRAHPVPQSDVWQIIAGVAGAPVDEVPGQKAAQKFGYLVVEVNGKKVTYQMKDASGKVIDSF
jgi:hypothetical protein